MDKKTVAEASKVCKELFKARIKTSPDVAEGFLRRCRIRFMSDSVFCAQRNLARAFHLEHGKFPALDHRSARENDPGRGAAPARQSDLRLRQEELRKDQRPAWVTGSIAQLSADPRTRGAAGKSHLKVTHRNSTAHPTGLAFLHHENKHFDTERPAAAVCDRCLIATRIASGELSGSQPSSRGTLVPSISSRNLKLSSNLNPPKQHEANLYLKNRVPARAARLVQHRATGPFPATAIFSVRNADVTLGRAGHHPQRRPGPQRVSQDDCGNDGNSEPA